MEALETRELPRWDPGRHAVIEVRVPASSGAGADFRLQGEADLPGTSVKTQVSRPLSECVYALAHI